MTIHSIAKQLFDYSKQLEDGTLSGDEILKLTELSREFHERMIVLRYKTVEESVEINPESARPDEANTPPNAEVSQEVVAEKEPEKPIAETPAPSEKNVEEPEKEENSPEPTQVSEPDAPLAYGPAVSPNQISLIDSIEEIKRMEQSLNDSLKNEATSLAEKLHKKPISNLKTAVTINQKFQFIGELFGNNADEFYKAIDRLNRSATFLEADEYIQNTLKDAYDWDMKSKAAKELMDLVERKFL